MTELSDVERDRLLAAVEAEKEAVKIARVITASIAGRRWRDMTPLDVARYLVDHGARVTPPAKWSDLFGIDPDYTEGVPVKEWLEANRGEA